MRRVAFDWVLVLGCMLTACGGSDENKSTPPAAVGQCGTFVSTWCGKAMGCLVTLGTLTQADRSQNESVCVDTGKSAAQCDKAISIGTSYNQCLNDVNAMDCNSWNVPTSQLSTVTPPSTCQGVITISG